MSYPCMKRRCTEPALKNSAYCGLHQSRQEIEDRHGLRIEERAKGGLAQRIWAEADRDDDIKVAEDFQAKERREQHIDETAMSLQEAEQKAREMGPELYKNAFERTRAELLAAPRVQLFVPERQVMILNGVKWYLEEGMNSVPHQIKARYDNRQKALRENKTMQKILGTEDAGARGLPYAYYEDVLKRGYRGEVIGTEGTGHDRASKM